MAVESLFGPGAPTVNSASDWGGPHSVGITMTFAVNGNVTGARTWIATNQGEAAGYYKARLYRVDTSDPGGSGTLLASKDFGITSDVAAWNTVNFDTPVAVTAGTVYRIVRGSEDWFTIANGIFASAPIVNGNITGVQNNATVGGLAIKSESFNGFSSSVYTTNASGFTPAGSVTAYIDVLFEASGASFSPAQSSQFLTFF